MWLIYSISCAFSDSIASLGNKKLVSRKLDPVAISYFVHGLGAFGFLMLAIYSGQNILGISPLSLGLVMLTAALAALAGVLILVALKKGDLSLIAPIQTLTPLFVLIIAVFFLKQTPSPIGLAGILLVVMGGVFLDKNPRESLPSVLKRIVSYQPALVAVAAAFLFALASVLDARGLQSTSVGIWILYIYFFIFLFLTPVVIFSKRKSLPPLKAQLPLLLFVTCFHVLAILFQFIALGLKSVSYVMSIKRLSSVFAVLLAYAFLNEKRAVSRIPGAIVMVAGAVLIGLS
jgi:drug/metabolite transporter (DMT)-like permease